MKKIYLKESSLSDIINSRLLPNFLFKGVKKHETSIGDSVVFPSNGKYPYDYTILKTRYCDVCDAIESLDLESLEEDYLMSRLNSLVKECMEIERPVRDALERVCENALNTLFAIPSEMINMTFKLVDKVKFKGGVRMEPESEEDTRYTFKDLDDIELGDKAIAKRRLINSLIQGAAYTYAKKKTLYEDEINKINQDLCPLYDEIRVINDYLLFTKKEEMSDKKPMQGAYVEVRLGQAENKTSIDVQGIIFPLLFQDAIKGMFELFSAHGLPKDIAKAKYVVRKSDFLLAEPWDLRLGVGLWENLFNGIEDTNLIPYVFTSFVSFPIDEFNTTAKEVLSRTEKGKEIMTSLIKDAEHDNDYQSFTNRINAKNLSKSLINDTYFASAETNGYDLGANDEEINVIEEDEFDGNSKNNSVEIWYRGIGGAFDKMKNKRQIWLADELEYAAEYANEYEDGHLYEFHVDMSKLKDYDWQTQADSYFDPIDGFSEREIKELMEMGYNGYMFALDEATVLVLFDDSLVVDVKEIPMPNYLEESVDLGGNGGNYEELLANATIDNVDFAEGEEDRYGEEVFLTIDNVKIPRDLVNLTFRPIYKRFPMGKRQLLNIDIFLDKNLRGQGLATKIYVKAVREFGALCSRFSTRHNDSGIRALFNKLSSFGDIYAFEDAYENAEGEMINDYYAILKSELPKYFGHDQ